MIHDLQEDGQIFSKQTKKKERTQIIKIRKKRRNINTNLTEIKMNERE